MILMNSSDSVKVEATVIVVCQTCGETHSRPREMSAAVAAAYDALFPHTLEWNEEDDCGMSALMLQVALKATEAVCEAVALELDNEAKVAEAFGDISHSQTLEESAATARRMSR